MHKAIILLRPVSVILAPALVLLASSAAALPEIPALPAAVPPATLQDEPAQPAPPAEPLDLPAPAPAPRSDVRAQAQPGPAPAPSPTSLPASNPGPQPTAPAPAQEPDTGDDAAPEPGLIEPLVQPGLDAKPAPQAASPVASSAVGQSILPDGRVLPAAIAAVVIALAGALVFLRRRRKEPHKLRLALPSPDLASAPSNGAAQRSPTRFDLQLDIQSATRSVMMFSLDYRLELANRSDRGASDVKIALQLSCARHGAANAPDAGAAQNLQTLERIGAQQSRSITGTLRLPVADLAILKQGATPLFVPLVHIMIEGENIEAFTRSYLIGTPSTISITRVHPLALDTPPGSIAGLRAQIIDIPPDRRG